MAVHQEIAAGSIFILADAALGNGSLAQRGKTVRHIAASLLHGLRRGQARLRIGIDAFAVPIESDFQPPRLQVRHAVYLIVLEQPRRQRGWSEARIPWRRGEEKNFLPRGKNTRTENLRKK